jgi:hypothetical protein
MKKLWNDKGKDDRPIWSRIISLLQEKYEILSTVYHDGELNGFCCHRLLADRIKRFSDTFFFFLKPFCPLLCPILCCRPSSSPTQ